MKAEAGAPVVIEAAINGMTSKSRNPAVPKSTDELIADSLACLDAGASIIHFHVSSFELSTQEAVDEYAPVFRGILHERPDAIIYPTGKQGKTMAERMEHFFVLADMGLLKMGYFDPGSVNIGAVEDQDGLPSGGYAYVNTYDECREMFGLLAKHRIAPSIAIYEPGFLSVVLAYVRAGRLSAGAMLKFYFGGEFSPFTGERSIGHGLPPTAPSLDALLAMYKGCSIPWAVGVFGGDVGRSEVLPHALELGGHVRLGLEDYCGARTPNNVELIKEVSAMARRAGRRLATPVETAALLGIPIGSALQSGVTA
jgi:3-keto-5-aminohexanoate cleavage enzyme